MDLTKKKQKSTVAAEYGMSRAISILSYVAAKQIVLRVLSAISRDFECV